MFNNNFQNPVQNNFQNPINNNLQNPIQNNPMLQYYQQLLGQIQQPQQVQDPKVNEMLDEYKKIPAVAEKIKTFEEFKKETNNLEFEINKGFEEYYKSKTDPNYGLIANLTAKIDNLEKLLANGGNKNG